MSRGLEKVFLDFFIPLAEQGFLGFLFAGLFHWRGFLRIFSKFLGREGQGARRNAAAPPPPAQGQTADPTAAGRAETVDRARDRGKTSNGKMHKNERVILCITLICAKS